MVSTHRQLNTVEARCTEEQAEAAEWRSSAWEQEHSGIVPTLSPDFPTPRPGTTWVWTLQLHVLAPTLFIDNVRTLVNIEMTGWRIQLHATIVMHTCKACSLSADDPVVALR